MTTFLEKLDRTSQANRSLLCVGLDPDPDLMPVADVAAFNRAVIEATSDLVCAYKPNLAFYEALGLPGLKALQETVEAAHQRHIPVIGDAKRNDIGNSSRFYAKAMFQVWGFDAITVNPLMGEDSVAPFLEYRDRGVLLLCRTSNPGARDLFELPVVTGKGQVPMYEHLAALARRWNTNGNVGLVVGATAPREVQRVRGLCPDMPFLIPGVGAQAGDLETAVRHGVDAQGRRAIVNASRTVIYASRGADYAQAARRAAQELRDHMNAVMAAERKGW